MEDLIDAMMATYAANTTLSASLSGSLYFEEAIPNASQPYGALFINAVTPTGYLPISTLTNRGEEYLVQFNIWDGDDNDPSRTVITGIEADMQAAFDYNTMTIANHAHIETRPVNNTILRDPEKRWQLSMEYRIRVRRTA